MYIIACFNLIYLEYVHNCHRGGQSKLICGDRKTIDIYLLRIQFRDDAKEYRIEENRHDSQSEDTNQELLNN